MDAYPAEFVQALHPLLHVGGLDEEIYAGEPAFVSLVSSLRRALTAKNDFRVYDSSRGQLAEFHVVLVEKVLRARHWQNEQQSLMSNSAQNARFPPRKGSGPSAGHSPLSPLSPASPLYPDGLMAPIWIKKHREMIPAAFVLVLRLWEAALDQSLAHLDPLSPGGSLQIEERERQRDAELVQEISERKRQTAERGIKLAVVLLTSRKMLDDANLDYRLSIIRRQSSLDARASLFVISPVLATEVQKFVASLRGELYEGAVDYYREHGRRARRKRSRVPTHVSRPIGQTSGPVPLGPQAWSVRYDYKMAVFAELRQEVEVAIKHYEDCYDGLLELFESTTALPPRTKRWLEAKVVADCTNAKICKLYMYTDESDRCLAQHHKHVARFRDLCRGWSIGEDTFEYWSWLTKQHRLFADLLDAAMRAGFRLPFHRSPAPPSKAAAPPSVGTNPSTALLHPGYYYFVAAQCAEERKLRFRTLEAAETEMNGSAELRGVTKAIEHERQVKHDEQIIELYTKSYDFFKRLKAGRSSLFVAGAIAEVHYQAGNHSIALRFYERIAKTYRQEGWRPVLEAILHRSYVGARQQQDVPAATKLAIELLALGPASADYAIDFELGLAPILGVSPAPDDAPPIMAEESSLASLLHAQISFWSSSALLDEKVAFQLVLTAPSSMAAKEIAFSSLSVDLGSDQPSFRVEHGDGEAPNLEDPVPLSKQATRTNLVWWPGSRKIFTGFVSSGKPSTIELLRVVMHIEDNGWQVQVPLKPNQRGEDDREPLQQAWYLFEGAAHVELPNHGNPSVTFVPRTFQVAIDVGVDSPAYLGENFPIVLSVANNDKLAAFVVCDLLLQPPADEMDANTFVLEGDSSINGSHRLEFGQVAVGNIVKKTVFIRCDGLPGARQLDVSMLARPEAVLENDILPLAKETSQTLAIDAIHPFSCQFKVAMQHERARPPQSQPIGDLSPPDAFADSVDFLLSARFSTGESWPIEIHSLKLQCDEVADRVRELECTLAEGVLPTTWEAGETFGLSYRLEVAAKAPSDNTGYLEAQWRKRCVSFTLSTAAPQAVISAPSKDSPFAITRIPLPPLVPPIALPRVVVTLPSYVVQHQPTVLIYSIVNDSLTQPLRISLQVEGGEPWAFSGPRRSPPLLVLPRTKHDVRLTVVATSGAGDVLLPVVRVLEHITAVEAEEAATPSLGDEEQPQPVRTRELPFVVEGSPSTRPLTVFVVPKGA